MTPTLGARLGPYEILSAIGAGGMGEVWKARDTRLDRIVAIKILRDTHSDLQTRFVREAKAIAALAHPNICTLFDIGHEQGTDYLVMEHLEGETLAARLKSGSLLIAQALHYAVQMASALDTAHRAGIVHRDLKPSNVMLVKGDAKLLDFGLAKHAVAELETITAPGMILGTVQYMPPEQLEGRDADARTDVFAFGTVLYEMLTGAPAFAGTTQASVVAAILEHEPAALASVLPSIPPALDRVVRRCLAKDPDERWQTARDLTSELRWVQETSSTALAPQTSSASATTLRQRPKPRIYWAAAVMAALVAASSALYVSRAPNDAPEMRLQVDELRGSADFAVSPDGRTIVFAAAQLWVRPLGAETASPLAATEGGRKPFWSPDSRSVGFFANGQLKRIDVGGGPPVVLASAPVGLGGTWNPDGVILFTPQNTSPVLRVAATGGEVVEATRMGPPGITDQWYPYFLPDGRHFLFYAWGTPDQKGVYLGSLDSKDVRRLFDAISTAVFAPPDQVLYARQGPLVAQRVDMRTYAPVGDPQTVAGAVEVDNNCGYCAAVSAAATGPIAYKARGAMRQLVWVDRSSGQELGTLGSPDAAPRFSFRPSPDGRSVAFHRDGEYTDIWRIDTISGVTQRFTFDAGNKYSPVWSPDGRRIVFSWDPKGDLDLYEKPVDSAGNGTLLWGSSEHKHAQDWSPDGRYILFMSDGAKTGLDLWALPLFGDKKPLEVAHTAFREMAGRFSPDSRWIAYQSNETGREEIYVQPFLGPGGKQQISNDGGSWPEWNHDGRELYYRNSRGSLMAVSIKVNGSAIDAGKPVVYGPAPLPGPVVLRDSQRFLVDKVVRPAPPVTVLLNWKPR